VRLPKEVLERELRPCILHMLQFEVHRTCFHGGEATANFGFLLVTNILSAFHRIHRSCQWNDNDGI